ncbi:tetratricopeptide repeat protein [Streptomyces werraensis]|uniref:tetratricopeptide repeat protein n=1 Tax=Streptomyces werraensis TaxID=68284 RepID=UPI0036FBF337
MTVAQKKKTPNLHLGRLIREAGWSETQLATAVNKIGTEVGRPSKYEQSAVSHWLSGTMPRKEARAAIVEALSRRLFRPVTYAEAGFPAPEGDGSPLGTVEGLVDLGRLDMDPSRRSVLGAALFSVALTIPDWQDVVGRVEAFASGQAVRIGMGEVDMVIAMTERVSELDDQFGGRHARPMAAAFLVNTVAGYLKAQAPDNVRKAMMSAASDLCYLTGYMAVDEGLHGLAQRYYLKALELAGASEDHLTYCTTLRGMSVQAVDLGHGAHAMRLADAAAAASPQAGPRMRAFLAGQQAHAAAQIGESRKALQFMSEAEKAMEIAESRAKAFGSYDPSSLMYHLAQVKHELGDNSGAVEAMQESNKLRHSIYRRAKVRHLGLTAERQLSIGHLEAAVDTWNEALDEYPLVQSGRCDERMREMVSQLSRYSSNGQAKALLERARAVGVPVAV